MTKSNHKSKNTPLHRPPITNTSIIRVLSSPINRSQIRDRHNDINRIQSLPNAIKNNYKMAHNVHHSRSRTLHARNRNQTRKHIRPRTTIRMPPYRQLQPVSLSNQRHRKSNHQNRSIFHISQPTNRTRNPVKVNSIKYVRYNIRRRRAINIQSMPLLNKITPNKHLQRIK